MLKEKAESNTDRKYQPKTFLIIQTAFIGDVILATALVEKLHAYYPNAIIDFLLRKGNESLFDNHPYINKVLIWNKKEHKTKNMFKILLQIRKQKYDYVINCQRFFSTGIFTAYSNAKIKIGFNKNPLSHLFTKRISHTFDGLHETERNQKLIADITDEVAAKPKIYPKPENFEYALEYITISPASVWFTKQYPKEKWIEFINQIPTQLCILLLGGENDKKLCEEIKSNCIQKNNILILAGQMTLLQSAAIMQKAVVNYVNDSAPMHLCSAVNAPVCVLYCSTIPAFGYGPLSDFAKIIEVEKNLECRPCGIHGYKICPQAHFNCALDISTQQLLQYIL